VSFRKLATKADGLYNEWVHKEEKEMSCDKIEQGVNLFETLINECEKITTTLQIEPTPQTKYACMLFKDIIYLNKSCLYILKANSNIIALPTIARSVFERIVDLFLICKDDKVIINLLFDSAQQQKKFFENIKEDRLKCPELALALDDPEQNLKEAIKNVEKYDGYKLGFKDKVDDLVKTYGEPLNILYLYFRKFSSQSHSNLFEMTEKYKKDKHEHYFDFAPPVYVEFDYLFLIKFLAQNIKYSLKEIEKFDATQNIDMGDIDRIYEQIAALL